MPKTKTKKMTEESVAELLRQAEQLTADAEALMEEHGIPKLLAEAAALKKSATEWAVANNVEQIVVDDETGRYYGLRQDTYNKRVVSDDDELDELKNPSKVIPLKRIVKSKFGDKKKLPWTEVWKQITTRKVDVVKLENAVKKGLLTVDEISPAYYHDTKAPYLRSYGK